MLATLDVEFDDGVLGSKGDFVTEPKDRRIAKPDEDHLNSQKDRDGVC